MNDIPITVPQDRKPFPVENSETMPKAANGQAEPVVAEPEMTPELTPEQVQQADLAERFIMKLPMEEIQALVTQRSCVEKALAETRSAQQAAFSSQVVANMLQIAYNAGWKQLQSKYGLPDDLDVDWKDGSIFRKADKSQES